MSLAPIALPISPAVCRPFQPRAQDPELNRLLATLAELPPAEWLSIGRSILSDPDTLLVRRALWPVVDAIIDRRNLRLAAWYVRDAIDTAVLVATGGMSGWSRDNRCACAAAHAAAEGAALALLAQEFLECEAVTLLLAPFTQPLARVSDRKAP